MCKAEEICSLPLVVIKCLTYNHQPYIRQCLDGFIMQKTNFPFIAVIHDDASTDGTAEVVKEYEMKYPTVIKGIYQKENQYRTNPQAIDNSIDPFITGKYIALCEGDDYWTDPLKLQKQVDFLEKNKEYVTCFHNAKILNESAFPIHFKKVEEREYLCKELYDDWIVPTASIMIKTDILLKKKIDYSKLLNGDIFWVMSAFEAGKVYGLFLFANIETHKLDPIVFLTDVFRRIKTCVREELVNLLPHRWQPATVIAGNWNDKF